MIVNEHKKIDLQETPGKYSIKVLLVDDREENLISLESLLRKDEEDICYLLAHSGEEALKIALREELALILLDVQMPGMNGYEVARFLMNNSRTKNIPIIFVTAIDQGNSRMEEGFEAGAVDFLFKPLHPNITKAKVSAFLNFYIQRKEMEKVNKELEKANQNILIMNQELEERVRERTKELMKINNDLDNFIYTASHDLKAPINNIEGLMSSFYDMIGENTENYDDITIIRNLIGDSIERFKNTLVDLTDLAKAQSEETTDSIKIILKEVMVEVKLSISDQIDKADAEITEDFSQAPSINFSKKNLRSIVYNLVSNAVKYRDIKKKLIISICSYKSDGFIILSVKDNGLGIKKEDHHKVFGMFKRLHTHVEGTGMGMAIVKRIIENNGGKIELESAVGVGSEFKIWFPEE